MKDTFNASEVYPEGTPGSPEAVEAGCRCPIMDNGYGQGYMGREGCFVISAMCKLHGQERIWDTEFSYGQDRL